MSMLSQFLGGNAVPVGGLIFTPGEFTASEITGEGKQYLRTGIMVPYDTKYDTLINAGMTIVNRWAGLSASCPAANTSTMGHVLWNGARRQLVNAPVSSAANSMKLLQPATPEENAFVRPPFLASSGFARTSIHYMPQHGLWVYGETGISGTEYTYKVWTSKNGISWNANADWVWPNTSYQLMDSTNGFSGVCGDYFMVFASYYDGTDTNYICTAIRLDADGNKISERAIYSGANQVLPIGPWWPISNNRAIAQIYAQGVGLVDADQGFPNLLQTFTTNGSNPNSVNVFVKDSTVIAAVVSGSGIQLWVGDKDTGTFTMRQSIASATSVQYITWTGAYYVVATTSGSYRSTDAITWSALSANPNWPYQVSKNHYYSTTTLYNLSDNSIAASGVPWDLSRNSIYSNIATIGSTMVATTTSNIVRSTDNGKSWDIVFSNTANSTPLSTNSYVKVVNNRFVILMLGQYKLMHSTDGLNWTTVDMSTAAGWSPQIYDVAFYNGTWVAVGTANSNKNYAYSTDLVNWTSGAIKGTFYSISGVFATNSKFLAIYNSGMLYSSDGITWTDIGGTFTSNTWAGGTMSFWVEGTTTYAFCPHSSASSCNLNTSTDGGATWSNQVIAGFPKSGTSTSMPMMIKKIGSTYYALSSSSWNGRSMPYALPIQSTNLVNWGGVPVLEGSYTSGTSDAGGLILDPNNILYYKATGSNDDVKLTVLDVPQAKTFCGIQNEINIEGAVGYVRYK